MKDVTQKVPTKREAIAESKITMPPDIQTMLRERRLEKGDALEIARVAGVMAAKKTWEIIPYCHPIPVTGVDITYEYEPDGVRVKAAVRTIAPNGRRDGGAHGGERCHADAVRYAQAAHQRA